MDGQLVQLSCPRDLTTELMALMDDCARQSERFTRQSPALGARQSRTPSAGRILEESSSRCTGTHHRVGAERRTTRRRKAPTPSRSFRALRQNLWVLDLKRKRPLREKIASWDIPRSRWSYHASSTPGMPQDAYPDDPQSRREVQVLHLRRRPTYRAGRRAGLGGPDGRSQEQSSLLLRVSEAWSALRSLGGASIRVRPVVGNPRLPGLPDASRRLPTVWGDGGDRPLG